MPEAGGAIALPASDVNATKYFPVLKNSKK